MRLLVLGGTAWLGRCIATTAVQLGHHVACLARGDSGSAPSGAVFVRADRDRPDAYDAVSREEWDVVVWLIAHGVEPWMGERSLPLWLPLPEYAGFNARDSTAARAAGLVTRPLADTLADTLAWELSIGPDRPRRAGLTEDDERFLLAAALAG